MGFGLGVEVKRQGHSQEIVGALCTWNGEDGQGFGFRLRAWAVHVQGEDAGARARAVHVQG